MKTLSTFMLVLAGITLAFSSIAQQKYYTDKGNIHFLSKALIEDIEAVNDKVICMVDIESREIAFKVPVKSFEFEKALMEEHFNENYLESEKYPYATFSGTFEYVPEANKAAVQNSIVEVKGDLTLHGITQSIVEKGVVEVNDGIVVLHSEFVVELKDYKVKVPKLMFQNIAERITVTIEASLLPYEN